MLWLDELSMDLFFCILSSSSMCFLWEVLSIPFTEITTYRLNIINLFPKTETQNTTVPWTYLPHHVSHKFRIIYFSFLSLFLHFRLVINFNAFLITLQTTHTYRLVGSRRKCVEAHLPWKTTVGFLRPMEKNKYACAHTQEKP